MGPGAGPQPGLLALCEALHYDLVALHLRIQMAAAYARLGRQDEGLSLLQQALAQARPRTALSCPLRKISGI